MTNITDYTQEQLEQMNTVLLLNILKSARAHVSMASNKTGDESFDQVINEVCAQPFIDLVSRLKLVLSTRDHIPSKKERKENRQLKQQEKQNR